MCLLLKIESPCMSIILLVFHGDASPRVGDTTPVPHVSHIPGTGGLLGRRFPMSPFWGDMTPQGGGQDSPKGGLLEVPPKKILPSKT